VPFHNIQDEIKNETTKDDSFVKALQAVKENGPLFFGRMED